MDELRELIEKYAKLKRDADDAEELRKRLNTEAAAIEADIKKKWEVLGIGTVCDLDGAPVVRMKLKLKAEVTDRGALSKWLERTGNESLGTYSVHHATLSKFCSEVMDEGGDIPDGVKISHHKYLKVDK